MRRSRRTGSRCPPWRKAQDWKKCRIPRSHLTTLDNAKHSPPPWALSSPPAKEAPAHLRGKSTVTAPAAGYLHGTLTCFLQSRTPSWSRPRTWSWLAPRQLFQHPRLMTAPAPRPESGTRTTSRRPSSLLPSSLDVQGSPDPRLTPPLMKTMMTSEPPSPSPEWLRVLPLGLLLCLLPLTHLPPFVLPGSSPRGPEALHPSIEAAGTALPGPKQQPQGRGTALER